MCVHAASDKSAYTGLEREAARVVSLAVHAHTSGSLDPRCSSKQSLRSSCAKKRPRQWRDELSNCLRPPSPHIVSCARPNSRRSADLQSNHSQRLLTRKGHGEIALGSTLLAWGGRGAMCALLQWGVAQVPLGRLLPRRRRVWAQTSALSPPRDTRPAVPV